MANRLYAEFDRGLEREGKKMKKGGMRNDDGRLGGPEFSSGKSRRASARPVSVDPNAGAPKLRKGGKGVAEGGL